jgi:hypothetical protein
VPDVTHDVCPVLDAAPLDFRVVLCGPHTFGGPLLSENWDGKLASQELWSANSKIRIGLQVRAHSFAIAEVPHLRRTANSEKPRRRWGQGGAFNGRFA